jgi:hypothetical protein
VTVAAPTAPTGRSNWPLQLAAPTGRSNWPLQLAAPTGRSNWPLQLAAKNDTPVQERIQDDKVADYMIVKF